MAELTAKFAIAYSPTDASLLGVYVCRYLAGAYGNPALPFAAGTNEWWLLTETVIDATASFYTEDIPKGRYKVVTNTLLGGFADLDPYVDIWHGTQDIDNHINDAAADMRHDHDAIAIEATDQGRLGLTLDAALDNITGATWDKDTDDNLKEHLDDTTDAHPASAISCTVGATTDVESALDDHETRITALETGTATTPAGIGEVSSEVGVSVYWTPQDVNGIEYRFRYLWKHSYETAPAAYTDLNHERRQESPETEVLYASRRFDLAVNTDSDLVLYYAIGAKGRADASPHWSSVQGVGVIIPKYTQEHIMTLTDVSWAQVSPSEDKDRERIESDEVFPTCSGETGGTPDDNYLEWTSHFDSISVKGIAIVSGDAMSGTATLKYISTTGGAPGSFTVSNATRRGDSGAIALTVNAGDSIHIWSLDTKGIGHYQIQIKYEVL